MKLIINPTRKFLIFTTIIGFVGWIIFTILFITVVPVFEVMYNDFGAIIPFPTRACIELAKWMESHAFVSGAMSVLLLVLVLRRVIASNNKKVCFLFPALVVGSNFILAMVMILPIFLYK